MRHLRVYLLLFTSVFLMGCPTDDTPPPPPPPPPTPCTQATLSATQPLPGEVCTELTQQGENELETVLRWSYIGGSGQNARLSLRNLTTGTQLITNQIIGGTSATVVLQYEQQYRWSISAESCDSDINGEWDFTTEGSPRANTIPSAASILVEDIIGGAATVKWSSTDMESGTLTYRLFLGQTEDLDNDELEFTTSAPRDVEQSFQLSNLQTNTTYYVKVETEDLRGNISSATISFLAL